MSLGAARSLLLCFRLSARGYARQAASAKPRRKDIVRTTPSSILALYSKHSSSPVLALVDALRSPSPLEVRSLLGPASVPDDEYERWAPVVHAPSLPAALDRVAHTLAAHPTPSAPSTQRSLPVPAWALLSVLLRSPSTPLEAFAAHSLAFSLPPPAHPDLSPLALLLDAHSLASFRMYAPSALSSSASSIPLPSSTPTNSPSSSTYSPSPRLPLKFKTCSPSSSTSPSAVRSTWTLTHTVCSSPIAQPPSAPPAWSSTTCAPAPTHPTSPILVHSSAYTPAEVFADYPNESKHRSRILEEYLRAFKDPATINAYIKYLFKTTASTRQDPDFGESKRPPTLPGAGAVPRQVFLHSLRTVAGRLSVPTDDLLHMFRQSSNRMGGPKKLLSAYFYVIKGLLRRGDYARAAALLEEVLPRKSEFDAAKLTIAVEALTMVNRPDAALQLLLHISSSSTPTGSAEEKSPYFSIPSVHSPKPSIVDTRTLNGFMISLLRIGRPDAIFLLWDLLPLLLPDISPDSKSLAILFKAARFARKCEGALQVAIADFGLSRILPVHRPESPEHVHLPSRDAAWSSLEALLAPDPKRAVNGFWRGERAGDVALRVAWQVFVRNWPILQHFSSPFRVVRNSAGEQATSPMRDLFHSLRLGSASYAPSSPSPSDSGAGSSSSAPASEGDDLDLDFDSALHPPDALDPTTRWYLTIVPEDAAFRALLDLLASEDRSAQIPLVLTWMRYLRVWPSRDTLATALVYWGEVTLEGPWVVRMREWSARRAAGYGEEHDDEPDSAPSLDPSPVIYGGQKKRGARTRERGRRDEERGRGYESEYVRMVKWLTKWVGRHHMPGREETQRALQRVRWFRDMQAFRPLRDEDVDGDWSHL
ncbi:hypothetical protein C8Q74DRAFT_1372929 [Fomes fomentarius]|nr:hypothetical protein C8Q74DRAFT_1372929 [Fomes fomentarius]